MRLSLNAKLIWLSILQLCCIPLGMIYLHNEGFSFFNNFLDYILLFIIFLPNLKYSYKKYTWLSLIFLIYFCCEFNVQLRTDFKIPFNELEDYLGTAFNSENCKKEVYSYLYPHRKCLPKSGYFYLKDEWLSTEFICNIVDRNCKKLLTNNNYWLKKDSNDIISVKYAVISFFSYDKLLVYEISKNGKIIYSYDFFVQKYQNDKKRIIYFLIFLLFNVIIFFFLFKRIKHN